MYLGDFQKGRTVRFKFTTVDSTGTPIVLSGTPAISIYKDDSTSTETTTGVTLTVSQDSVVGMNHVSIATTDSFYTRRADYQVVITTGTVDGNSVVGYTVGHFSIENRPAPGIILGVAQTGTLSSTQMTSDLAGYSNDVLIGRRIIWQDGALIGTGALITDYASTNGLLTFTSVTTSPSNGDLFIII